MAEPGGWAGTVVQVDLTRGRVTKLATALYEPEKFIGGVGLNTRIFWQMGCPKVGALDPENPLLISVGPLTGLPGPFGRAEVCSVSPQTHPEELFTYSGFGGKWPSQLKYAGYDAVVVVGRADGPVYLSIDDEEVILRDATDLMGLDSLETQQAMREGHPAASILCIGPAGEQLSRNATLSNETGNTAGQGGFGAVMGSKNLKAIAVRGSGSVRLADAKRYFELIAGRKAKRQWLEGASQSWGRSPLTGGKPIEQEMVGRYRRKFAGCYGCPYQCSAFYDVPGIGRGTAMCASWWYGRLQDDAKAMWEALLLAQKLGVNHYDLVGVMRVLREIALRGLMSPEEWKLAGLPPLPAMWGGTATHHEFLTALIGGIADGSSPFSEGGARACDRMLADLDRKDEVGQVCATAYPAHGHTVHFYGWIGLALHVALDSRDAGNSTDPYLSFNALGVDVYTRGIETAERGAARIAHHFGVPWGPTTYAHPKDSGQPSLYEGVERQTFWTACNQSLANSMPMCNFACLPDQLFDPPGMDIRLFQSEALTAVTGVPMGVEDVWRAGERIWNLRRAVMVRRENRRREQDTLRDAMFDATWTDLDVITYQTVPAQFDRREFEVLKDRFYRLSGWDVRTGRPTRERLVALGLQDVAEVLAGEGKLP